MNEELFRRLFRQRITDRITHLTTDPYLKEHQELVEDEVGYLRYLLNRGACKPVSR